MENRFLSRAEDMAGKGDHEAALGLLVVALDDSAGDHQVVQEAERIRQRVERSVQQQMRSELLQRVQSSSVSLDGGDRNTFPANPATAPFVPAPPRESRTGLVAVAWILFLASVLSVFLVTGGHWSRIETYRTYGQLQDPLDVAHAALDRGDATLASGELSKLIEQGDRLAESYLLLSRVERSRGSVEMEVAALLESVSQPDLRWPLALEAARRLGDLGRSDESGGAFSVALSLGAPPETWLEIADGLLASGNEGAALSLYQTIIRSHPPSATRAIEAIERLPL